MEPTVGFDDAIFDDVVFDTLSQRVEVIREIRFKFSTSFLGAQRDVLEAREVKIPHSLHFYGMTVKSHSLSDQACAMIKRLFPEGRDNVVYCHCHD